MKPMVAAAMVALALGLSACGTTPPERSDAASAAHAVQSPSADPVPSAVPTASAEPTASAKPIPSAPPTPSAKPTRSAHPAPSADPLVQLVDSVRPVMASMLKSQPTFSDAQVNALPPSTMEYRYVYAAAITANLTDVEAYFDSMVPTLQTTVDTQVFPAMVKAGIQAPRVTYTYVNPDGSVVWTHTFDPS
jgi:hypothetical protein